MADLISPIRTIVNLAIQIKAVAERVKANKSQCMVLSERATMLCELIQRLKEGVADLSVFRDCMVSTERCLQRCLVFVSEFDNLGWFRRVCENGCHKQQFQELNDALQVCIGSFNLSLVVDLKLKQSFAEAQKFDRSKEVVAEQLDQRHLASDEVQALLVEEHRRFQAVISADRARRQAELKEIHAWQKQFHLDEAAKARLTAEQNKFLQQQLCSIKQRFIDLAHPRALPEPTLPVDKSLIIKFADLDVFEAIGEGNNATVYAGRLYDLDVAIKYVKHLTVDTKRELFREATLLSRLKGSNIVRCYGVVIEAGNECLVMELMHSGTVKGYLISQAVDPMLQRQWALEIASGIELLHRQHAIHRDLKSSNILLSKDLHAKIGDFDLSVMDTTSLRVMEHTTSAYEYMAPEMRALSPTITEAVDVYSYGSILWEIVTRTAPPSTKNTAVLAGIAEPYSSIIARCWETEPSKRIKPQEVIKAIEAYHPVDYRALYKQGAEHEKAGRLDAAKECYLQSVACGYGRSEFALGMFYLQGKGRAASAATSSTADVDNKGEAFKYFQRATTHLQDVTLRSRSYYNLGLMLETGDGVGVNFLQAYKYYTESANLGNTAAAKKVTGLKPRIVIEGAVEAKEEMARDKKLKR